MEGSDDDDVLLENSPLYEYLKEACPDQDFLAHQTTSTHQQLQDDDTQDDHGNHKDKNGTVGFGPADWMTRLTDCKQRDAHNMAKNYLPRYMSALLGSQSLFEEDINIIMMFSNEATLSDDKKPATQYPTRHNSQSFSQILNYSKCALGLLATLISLCVGGYKTFASEERDITIFQIFTWFALIGLCATNATLYGSSWWVNSLLHRQHERNMKMLVQLLALHDEYGSLLRKCIRFVQEIEVISRGFTLATPFTPASQLEGLDGILGSHQCPVLREVCFQTSKRQILALKDATMSLLQNSRLQPEVDGTTSYLAKMDLDKIIPNTSTESEDADGSSDSKGIVVPKSLAILKIDIVEKYLLHHEKITSLRLLADKLKEKDGPYVCEKVMYDLYIEMKSEFFRRLILSVCPDAVCQDVVLDVNNLHKWYSILSATSRTSETTFVKLRHSYDWHKNRPTSRRRDMVGQGDDQYNRLQVKWSPAKHLVTAVHSLRLHLDVALNGAITAEEHLTGLPDDVSGQQEHLEHIYKTVEKLLEGANEKLQSSYSCVQQATVTLAKLQGKQTVTNQADQSKAEQTSQANLSAEVPMTTLTMPVAPEDMDFEDFIFEADMANEEHGVADQDFDTEWLIGEKARRKQEADETKHLLQELHTVLGQRSKEREIRNLKRKGVVVEDTNPDGPQIPKCKEHDDYVANSSPFLEDGNALESSKGGKDTLDSVAGVDEVTSPNLPSGDASILKDNDGNITMELDPSQKPSGPSQHALGLPFMTSLAAQAVMTSKLRGGLSEETFGKEYGDSSSEEDV